MKAIRYHEHGDADVLTVDDVPTPEPRADEVLVRVHAASVNPIDTYVREGGVEPAGGLPHVGGADVAGVVEAVGDDVEGFAVDDRVFATGLGLFESGSYAEYVAAPAESLASLPDEVSFVEGAAAAMAFATAWRGLVGRGELEVGDACLVQGGAGGVGHAAVQIAAHAGATVVATASDGDEAFVRGLGADGVVDYGGDDLADRVRDAAGGEIDVVLETHAAANITTDLDVLTRGGRIVVLGEEGPIRIDPGASMTGKIADADVRFMSIMASRDDQQPILERVGPRLADGTFEVEIEATYPFEEAAEAQRHVLSSGSRGKVVLEVR
ncbi:NADPH:quinone reductase [Haloplanus aerogenes]|uniref:NADPH:quinone reductase n=1 Tax=Haloplanus aerogenes TaxID=660522 RepID=A0A3M0CLG4_9EURY|nr:NADPH:quinone reductase [Haloplanus aerogenes]AZH26783.1 NADPH:quinone reductase [Haloplanus aerogenes]RMB09130.1 NADPH:quinone reductase-like Zn-dependent oxidoreductase [Haloplanus aerogenes]